METEVTLLLTGYEPNDHLLNASEIVVRSLLTDPPSEFPDFSLSVSCTILPGDTEALGANLRKLLERHRPKVCLFTGQAPGRNRLTFERLATNLRDFSKADRLGNLPKAQAIVAEGPAAYYANLPEQEALVDLLNKQGLPAAMSNHGGNHLCNQVLYQGLHLAATDYTGLLVGFVHIPALPVQVIRHWPDVPFMPLEMTRNALILAIRFLLEKSLAVRGG